ncbi:MAG: carboxylating nicotinate-nucleotide diphosphorylase [Gemmatimonadales bacterium]
MRDQLDAALIAADADRIARLSLDEDGARDVTSEASVAVTMTGNAVIEVREEMVLAGCAYADAVVAACALPPIAWNASDGDRVAAGSVAGTLHGSLRSILRAERPLLNLLQRACGVATFTRSHVDAVRGMSCRILHTRKTTPGLRLLEVSAVLAGGGTRHRLDLATAVMTKDNHWEALRAAGRTVRDALESARAAGVNALQVEVESIDQLHEALTAGATRILIDNQAPDTVAEWVRIVRASYPEIEVEATGGVTLDTLGRYAMTGVDFVSLGALTHSAPAADLGLSIHRDGAPTG